MTGELPRVTEILADVGLDPDYSMVPPDVLATARARGTAVHQAIEAYIYGFFDEDQVSLDTLPYLEAYKKFMAESGFMPEVSEVEIVNPMWRYRGHPDAVGLLPTGKTTIRAILDWKAVAALNVKAVGYQLAAYHAAWNVFRPSQPVQIAAAVHLREDATYRFLEIDLNAALPGFQAAVTVYWAKREVAE